MEEIFGIKIGCGKKSIVWFLAKKDGSGIKRTPCRRKFKWPRDADKAWIAPRRRPEARLTKKTVFRVRNFKEQLCKGSKGAEANVSKTETTVTRFTEVLDEPWGRELFAFLEILEDSEALALELFLFFGGSAKVNMEKKQC